MKRHAWQFLGLLAMFVLSSCAPQTTPPQPRVVQGVLDLRGWDLSQSGPVRLDGEWTFHWDASRRSLTEASTETHQEFMRVPGPWTAQGVHQARGKAVYGVRVLTSPGQRVYGLKLYEFPQSYRVYVNDQRIIENGRYAETPGLNARSLVRPYVVFANSSGSFNLWIEAVNLDEAEPGPRRSIVFGLEPDVRKVQDGQLIADVLVVGVLLIMALYHLGLYLQRRREMGSLLFGLLCLIMIFRIAVTEEHYLHKIFPQFPGGLEHTLDVFSFFILVPTFAWLFHYFFERDSQKRIVQTISAVFIVVSTVYAVAPTEPLFNFYLIFTLIVSLYLLSVLYLGVRNRRTGSRIFLVGFLLFVATTIWDMLSYGNIIRSIYVSQIGFVGFILAQAYVLSMRFNRALSTSEQLTHNLETLVAERTAALEESNRKLSALNVTDALTGIPNRRHFDEVLIGEWNRARRNGRPLALLVLDVDHFKSYNDHYGHQGGDACLQTVSRILATTVRRAGDTLARYGGEEFVVLLPECDDDEAQTIAQKIRQAIEAAAIPHAKSGMGIVSVSIGVKSIIPTETDSPDQLVRMADQALYAAKKQGRNRVVLADASVQAEGVVG